MPGAGIEGLRATSIAAAAAGDALFRSGYVNGPNGTGVRGGTCETSNPHPGVLTLKLEGIGWVDDLAVGGVVTVDQRTGGVTAVVDVRSDAGDGGAMTVTWNEQVSHALAAVTGTFDGRNLRSMLLAP